MDYRTGKLHLNPTDKEIIENQLRMISRADYDYLSGVSEEERPVMMALKEYCNSRAANGRHAISVQEKVAFRLGFKAGRESGGT